MTRIILATLFMGIIFTSCSKKGGDKDAPPAPGKPEDVYLVQQINQNPNLTDLKYNDKGQLIKVEYRYNENNNILLERYADISYNNNGIVNEVNYFTLTNTTTSQYHLTRKMSFHPDASQKLSMIANINYYRAVEQSKDSIDLLYNSQGQFNGYRERIPGRPVNEVQWAYDANGNVVRPNKRTETTASNLISNYERRYDNKINPITHKQHSVIMLLIVTDFIESIEQLFSKNNPVFYKDMNITETKNAQGQVTGSTGQYNSADRVPTYNEDGVMTGYQISFLQETVLNGQVTTSYVPPVQNTSYQVIKKKP